MDRPTKTAIKKLVLSLRKLLEEDIEVVLKRYGLFTDREWLPLDRIPKADDAILAARRRMEAAIAVEEARDLTPGEATRWYIREVAFIYLNRLVGLKCLEVRGLIEEVITTRTEYGGRSLFHRDFRQANPDLAAQPDDALPAMLEAACHHVTDAMIGVLFDPDSESSVIWPRYQTLRQAIGLINELPTEVWAGDEIIGWVYQFYNAEEKERIRDRGKPQLPIEVAVINQFFTPRWVVKFLVDNTLGRLWLEMHPDSERVRAKCDYLVPEPVTGVQRSRGAEEKRRTEGTQGNSGDGQDRTSSNEFLPDPNSPINNPTAPPRRPAKPVTEIRLIDPACGGMHFGYYAFEVFQEMYLDSLAYSWPIYDLTNEQIVNRQSKIENQDIPALILRHNLYGVDIDLRAIQLAALALYMKATTAELAAAGRGANKAEIVNPKSKIVNLVCADARLTNGLVRAKFLKEYEDDPALQKVWRELFREMEDIGQVGSLLRVEERFRQLLREYKPVSVSLPQEHEQPSLPGLEPSVRQMTLAELPAAYNTGWSPHRRLTEMLTHLRDFSRHALEEADVNAQLFAMEAEKTLGLLDVLLQDYDVVVMNPPYGYTTPLAKDYLRSVYPNTANDIYGSFIERAIEFVRDKGYVGALTSRSFLFLTTFKALRQEIILKQRNLVTLAEFGLGILDDATVRTAAYIIQVDRGQKPNLDYVSVFFGLRGETDRHVALVQSINSLQRNKLRENIFLISTNDLQHIPESNFAYWIPSSVLHKFQTLPTLDRDVSRYGTSREKIADVKVGLQTGDDIQFTRHFWEVPVKTFHKQWFPFAKGGSFSAFYCDLDLVVNYENDGQRLKAFPKATIRSERFYKQEGITYPATSEKGIGAYYLPPDSIPSVKGSGIYPKSKQNLWSLIAILNSRLLTGFLQVFTVDREHQVGMMASLPIALPNSNNILSRLSHTSYDLKAAWDTANEICTHFTAPWLLQLADTDGEAFETGLREVVKLLGWQGLAYPITLEAMLAELEDIEQAADAKLQHLQAQIDEAVYELYEISPADRTLIERELGNRPSELVWPQMEGKAKAEKRREHVRRLLSYFVLQALQADADGIVPLVEGTGQATALARLREEMESAFTHEIAFKLEDEARHILGKPIEQWLEREFSQWHSKLYKNRPILWHLASPQGTFSTLIYYHKLNRDTLPKVRNVYLWTLRDGLQKQLVRAREDKDNKAIGRLETALDDLTVFDERLASVIESGYAPVIDAGVKANILPLQDAGVLKGKVV